MGDLRNEDSVNRSTEENETQAKENRRNLDSSAADEAELGSKITEKELECEKILDAWWERRIKGGLDKKTQGI